MLKLKSTPNWASCRSASLSKSVREPVVAAELTLKRPSRKPVFILSILGYCKNMARSLCSYKRAIQKEWKHSNYKLMIMFLWVSYLISARLYKLILLNPTLWTFMCPWCLFVTQTWNQRQHTDNLIHICVQMSIFSSQTCCSWGSTFPRRPCIYFTGIDVHVAERHWGGLSAIKTKHKSDSLPWTAADRISYNEDL